MHYYVESKLWESDNWHVPTFSFSPKSTPSKEYLHSQRDNYDPNIRRERQFIKSLGTSLDDYSAIVSSLLQKDESYVLPIIFTPIKFTLT